MDETDLQWSRINQKGSLFLSKKRVGLQMRGRGTGGYVGKGEAGKQGWSKAASKGNGIRDEQQIPRADMRGGAQGNAQMQGHTAGSLLRRGSQPTRFTHFPGRLIFWGCLTLPVFSENTWCF